MNETTMTVVRSLPKVIGSALVTLGIATVDQSNSLMPIIEAGVGFLSLVWGYWWSHRAHK